ncbi:XdhC family protein [Agrobacterium sp. LMR679]|uniref:XdhC family protein n=1 Tax=Agrobacterium sp. LMR679 TaxID=3014335 RepID=UPI0022AE5483|nr:XdhC family protein [Agrobacterium sp. LMR679]MCZ4072001.1 XdhC family protein [Agrobacterium sp. LMR679]
MKTAQGSWEKFDDYVVDFALEAATAGKRFALVTLVRIEGASPRALGAQMAVTEDGEWVGYLSGGCLERTIVTEAINTIEAGRSRRLRFGEGSPYFDIQLPCGSALELYFDVEQGRQDLETVQAALAERHEAVLAFEDRDEKTASDICFRIGYLPRRRLIVLGTGPVAVLLCRLASAAGFEVELFTNDEPTLIFGREAGAAGALLSSPRRLPDLRIDRRSAVAFLFHDHDWEEELLPVVLGSDAFYIGAIGSRKTHDRRVQNLKERGLADAAIARIHGPAGIFGGSKSAADIALSILSQIVQLDPHGRDDRLDEVPRDAARRTARLPVISAYQGPTP